jgi:hypothetical protein
VRRAPRDAQRDVCSGREARLVTQPRRVALPRLGAGLSCTGAGRKLLALVHAHDATPPGGEQRFATSS